MQEIRNAFNSDLEESLLLAHSLITISSFGATEIIKNNPDFVSQFILPSWNLSGLNLDILHQATYGKIGETYYNHRGAIEEMVHARLVQRWYEFLSQVFEKILEEHFAGTHYNKKVSIKVDLKFIDDTNESLLENIKKRAIESFRFLKAKEQLETIEKLLDQKIPDNRNNPDDLVKSIRKHITVRNIFQHNKGIVRDYDLQPLGLLGNGITIYDNSVNPVLVRSGEKINLTFYELIKVSNDFAQAATVLIP